MSFLLDPINNNLLKFLFSKTKLPKTKYMNIYKPGKEKEGETHTIGNKKIKKINRET